LQTLTNAKIRAKGIRRVLLLTPKNVINHWEEEFNKWLFDNGLREILLLRADGDYTPKSDAVRKWYQAQGE